MAVQIGRLKIGFLPLSMLILFIVMTAGSIYAATEASSQPENSVSFVGAWIGYEIWALLITLIYGILCHFVIAFINRTK